MNENLNIKITLGKSTVSCILEGCYGDLYKKVHRVSIVFCVLFQGPRHLGLPSYVDWTLYEFYCVDASPQTYLSALNELL